MPSEAYKTSVRESTEHHARSKTFSGSLLLPHIDSVVAMSEAEGCESGLDYGCGKGVQFDPQYALSERLGYRLARYDPAVPAFTDSRLVDPVHAKYDMVILSHVLFWIPTEDLTGWVLPLVYRLANKAVFVVETIGKPKKKFLSEPEKHPRDLQAIDWLEFLLPHQREGVTTRLVTEYRRSDGRISAGYWNLP